MGIDANGDGDLSDEFYVLYETYYNGTNHVNVWQPWNITKTTGKFWSTAPVGTSLGSNQGGSAARNFTLGELQAVYPSAHVAEYGLNMGTYNPGWNINVDDFNFNGTVYNFEPATVAPCTTTSTVPTTNLASWYLGETRSAGSNQLVSGGLHVTAVSSADGNHDSKAAGYYATNFKLADAGVPDINIASGYTGTRPSLQLGVDKDGDGHWDGYLVYEPWEYGTGNFWSSKDFGISAGLGYTSFGTLNQYLAANPNARVISIGYSLGSGVVGDATITKLIAGCTDYTFGLPPLVPPTLSVVTPSEGSFAATVNNDNKLKITGSFTDDVKANYATFQLVHNGSSVSIGTLYGYGSVYNPTTATYADVNGSYTFNLPVPTNLPGGNYSLFYTGTDFDGGITTRMERKFTIDNTAPTSPVITNSPVIVNASVPNAQATWSDTATDVDHFEYREYASLAAANADADGNTASYWIVNHAANDKTQTVGQSWTGMKTLYYRIVAIDAAGNRSAPSQLGTVMIDKVVPLAPVVTATGLTSGDSTKIGSVKVNWTMPPSDTVKYDYKVWTNISTSRYNSDTLAYIAPNLTSNSRTGAFSEGQGTYFIQVRAYDAAGNISPWSDTFTVIYDTTAPTVAITSPADSATFGNGARITVDGSTGDAVSYTLSIGKTGETPLATDSGTSFTSYDWDTSAVASGSYIATLTGIDAAGNTSTSDVAINVDNTKPTIVIAPQANTASNQPTVTGTVDDVNATLQATFNGGTPVSVTNNAGTFSFTAPSALTNGTYSFSLQATDANENTTTQTADVVVAVAATPAIVSTVVTTGGATTTNTTVAPTGTTTANTPAATDNLGITGVLGAQTDATATASDTAATPEVKGASTQADQASGWALAWYWWLLIVAAAISFVWWLIARRRNLSEA